MCEMRVGVLPAGGEVLCCVQFVAGDAQASMH